MRMSRRWWTIGIGLVLVFVLVGCRGTATPAPSMPDVPIAAREGARAPDFTLRELGGAEVRLSELRGKVVLLNFWATW
jgi:cytochrome oxidase Cu insertion factor (SCO1/SenC/PrrC family)